MSPDLEGGQWGVRAPEPCALIEIIATEPASLQIELAPQSPATL